MNDLNLTLQEQRTAALTSEKTRWKSTLDSHERRWDAGHEWLGELHRWTVPIDPESYDAWLTGHLKRGGKVTHFYDYDMPRDQWYLATLSFEIKPLYGAQGIKVVVPKGVTVTGSTGHSALYFMDGFTSRSFHDRDAIVPCFNDTKIVES